MLHSHSPPPDDARLPAVSHAHTHTHTHTQQRLLVISFVILHAAQQLTGINAIFYYSNSFFVGIIDNPLVGTSLVGVVNVVATYVALQLMDKTGRVRRYSHVAPSPCFFVFVWVKMPFPPFLLPCPSRATFKV